MEPRVPRKKCRGYTGKVHTCDYDGLKFSRAHEQESEVKAEQEKGVKKNHRVLEVMGVSLTHLKTTGLNFAYILIYIYMCICVICV